MPCRPTRRRDAWPAALALLASFLLLRPASADIPPPPPRAAAETPRLVVRYGVPGDGEARSARATATVAALRARLTAFGVKGAQVVIERDGGVRVDAPDRAGLDEVLTRPGDLAFHLVDDDEATLRALAPLPDGVRQDDWQGPARTHRDLLADREELLAPLAARLPAGRSLGVGRSPADDSAAFHFEGVVLDASPALAGAVIRRAEARALPDGSGQSVVVTLTDEGARQLERITTAHVGGRLAILVDGEVEHVPKLREPIRGGVVQISRCAWRGRDDAPRLAQAYAAALATPLPSGVTVIGTERSGGRP